LADRVRFGKALEILPIPDLIRTQIESFGDFTGESWRKAEAARRQAIAQGLPDPGNTAAFGLRELFREISPITDFSGRSYELRFIVSDEAFGKPKYTVAECREQDRTYSAPLRVKATLLIKSTGEIKEQDIYFGEFPMMTPQGTFIISGTGTRRRVAVGAFGGRVLHARDRRHLRPAALPGKGDPQSRSLDGV